MSNQATIFEVSDGIAVLTLNRPDALNAMNDDMRQGVRKACAAVNQDAGIRVMVVTGAGERAFCAGADQRARSSGGAIAPEVIRGNNLRPFLKYAEGLPGVEKPVIAAVNGVCVGGGLGMVCACDIVVAAEHARFRVAHAALGWMLTKRIGAQRAFELYATNRLMDAHEAERVGLVFKVTPAGSLMDESLRLARTIAQGPPLGMFMTKRAIRHAETCSFEEYAVFERVSYQNTYYSEDSKEARQAFREKREPRFQGR